MAYNNAHEEKHIHDRDVEGYHPATNEPEKVVGLDGVDRGIVNVDQNALKKDLKGRHMQMIAM